MDESVPDEIVLVFPEPARPPEPAAAALAAAQGLADAERTFLKQPQAQYTGAGALAAAAGPVAGARSETAIALEFVVGDEHVSLRIAPHQVSDCLVSLYVIGAWEAVNGFLGALGAKASKEANPGSGLPAMPARFAPFTDPTLACVKAAAEALRELQELVRESLVIIAERSLASAHDMARRTEQLLQAAEQAYGVRAVQGAEDTFEVEDPGAPGLAEELVGAVQELRAAYGKILAEQNPDNPSPDSRRLPNQALIAKAAADFSSLLKAKAKEHRVVAGVLGLSIQEEGTSGLGTEAEARQKVFRWLAAYLESARGWLKVIPAAYPSNLLRHGMGNSTRRVNRTLGLALDDVPEVRAALWAGRDTEEAVFEPLLANQLLERVRQDILRSTNATAGEEPLLRSAFMLAVLNSYLATADARHAVAAARLAKQEAPWARADQAAACLSLLGLLVPPVGLVGVALGGYSMYGHLTNQFESLAQSRQATQNAAIDAVMADDSVELAQLLADFPRMETVVAELVLSFGGMHLASKIPVVGLAMQVVGDAETLLGKVGAQ